VIVMSEATLEIEIDVREDAAAKREDPIQALLRERFAAPGYHAPMLPAAAVEVLRLSQLPDVGIDDIVLVLEKDTLLAGRVLKLAQSAFYAGKSPAKTLVHAAVRLGVGTLRNVVLESAFHTRLVRGTAFDGVLSLAQTHSLGVAYLCRMVARSLEADADFAFMLGLMHETGLIAALTVLSEQRGQPLNPDVIASVRAIHGEAGGFVADIWKLPAPLRDAIANHHQKPKERGPAVLAIAEHLADRLGLGLPGFDDENRAERLEGALKVFSIDEKWLERLLGDGKRIVELALPE
jgi:HD-like signal output (HDOD) protein